MKKGKITMTIVLGTICFVLVCIMFIQFNTIHQTDVASIKTMRETELRTEIAKWKTKYEETSKRYEEVLDKTNEYTNKINENTEAKQLLEKDLEQSKMILGLTDVVGDGIIVTLENNDEKSIVALDILLLINELRLAGAEAIQVNDERIVSGSEVVDINNSFIAINMQRLSAPYVVKAIGNQAYLESGLTAKQYGYIDNMTKGYGKTVKLERKDNIKINKYEGEMKLENINS